MGDVEPQIIRGLGDICPSVQGLIDEEGIGYPSLVMGFKHNIYLKKTCMRTIVRGAFLHNVASYSLLAKGHSMELNEAFALALKELRGRAMRSQFDFAPMVSREYISLLERAQRSPSLEKIDEISSTLDVHALSLLAKCYLHKNPEISLSELLRIISEDLQDQIQEDSKNS